MEYCDVCGKYTLKTWTEWHDYGSTKAGEEWAECQNPNCGEEEEEDEN